MMEGSENHFANLAEYLEDDVLGPLGSELKGMFLDYKSSRKRLGRFLHKRFRSFRF